MEVSLINIKAESRHVLENLFPYYIYDMSEYMGWSPNENGDFSFNKSSLDVYWKQEDHAPFFIHADGEIAGFVLVRKYPPEGLTYDIEQFFVLRKFKGKGVGKQALKLAAARFEGRWQIRVLLGNEVALRFWKSAISSLVGENYIESQQVDIDLLMHFLTFEV
ncbi:GNAT family N-acetyltransferase [Enterovibrio makurazakiensis]|uniref:GNAT family N-acetyltransferase n=1 Tax=Enterovibrio makurazakiensis TaxID=2910232 RepID=UPI003D25C9C1